MLDDLLGRLEDADDVEAWADALTWVVEKIFDYLDFFRLMGSNRNIVEVCLESVEHDHTEMHARIEAAAHAAASSVAEEVRMIAALGAVTGFDDWAPTLLREADPLTLQDELTATVRDMLRSGHPASLNRACSVCVRSVTLEQHDLVDGPRRRSRRTRRARRSPDADRAAIGACEREVRAERPIVGCRERRR